LIQKKEIVDKKMKNEGEKLKSRDIAYSKKGFSD
jgi:hypothetical protein